MVGFGGVAAVGTLRRVLLGFKVAAVEEVVPRAFDVGRVAMVGSLVDENAEVVVAGLIGVLVVELDSDLSIIISLNGEGLCVCK